MDTTTLDFNTVTLMVTIAGSWLTIVGLIIYQSNRLDNKIDHKIDALGGDVSDIGQRVARIEGHLMGPESFSPRPLTPPTACLGPATADQGFTELGTLEAAVPT